MRSWDRGFKNAYGAAFAPNMELAKPYTTIPEMEQTKEDLAIQEKWKSGYGNLQAKVDNYLKQGKRLAAICIQFGTRDYAFTCRCYSRKQTLSMN